MKNTQALLGMVIFVSGIFVIPVIHGLHLDARDLSNPLESHNEETCTICKAMHSDLIAGCTHISIEIQQTTSNIYFLNNSVSDIIISRDHPARAPPVA